MDTLQFLVQCGRLMLLSLSLSVEGIYLLLNADKKAKHLSCLHELYLAELCSAAGLALDISNVGLVDTIKDSINHLKEIQVFCLTRVAIFLSIPATYSHDRYSILRLRSAIFLHNKFTWCRPSDVGKGRTHPLRRGNGVKSGAGSNTAQGLYHSLFLRSAYFYKYLILGLV